MNRIKQENNVLVNMDETGLIRIEGDKLQVQQTKEEIEEMVKKLENEKEKDVVIEQRHYRNIIGTKGDKIREIRTKFNQVQINFPEPGKILSQKLKIIMINMYLLFCIGDKRDIVKIRGPKEDVDKCHRYLQKLVKELNETSYQIQVPIFKQFHKFIIGKGGGNIKKIREETNTRIDLPAEGEKNDVITITGRKENVEDARVKIRKIQDELETIITEEITIEPKFYNSLIGTQGRLIHSIMEDCGGVIIKFPSIESKSDRVTIRGPKEDVDRAKEQLLELANERQLSSYTAEVRVFYIFFSKLINVYIFIKK